MDKQFRSKKPLEEDKPILVKEEPKVYNQTVSIRSMVDAKVKVTGAVTGKEYIWPSAGAVRHDIDIRDKDEILNKKRGRTCCGTATSKSLFELV